MYDDVWNRVVSGTFSRIPARMQGYRRLAIKGEEYPGMIEGDGTVLGCIWMGLDKENLARLDDFEGEYYERISAVAIDDANVPIAINFYCFKKEYHHLLKNHDWDEIKFQDRGLRKFMVQYMGFEKL